MKEYGDVFITSNNDVLKNIKKPTILIKMNFNEPSDEETQIVYDDFREFLNDEDKLNKISKVLDITCQKNVKNSLWTSIRSWISSFAQKRKEM